MNCVNALGFLKSTFFHSAVPHKCYSTMNPSFEKRILNHCSPTANKYIRNANGSPSDRFIPFRCVARVERKERWSFRIDRQDIHKQFQSSYPVMTKRVVNMGLFDAFNRSFINGSGGGQRISHSLAISWPMCVYHSSSAAERDWTTWLAYFYLPIAFWSMESAYEFRDLSPSTTVRDSG